MTGILTSLIETYKEQDGVQFNGPQTKENIANLEEALGIKFPPSFAEFLELYGGGGKKTLGISGISRSDPLWKNRGTVYGDTLLTREDFNLPEHLVVVLRDYDSDSIWCLDCSKTDGTIECPIVNFDEGVTTRTHKDFADFMEEYIRLRIK